MKEKDRKHIVVAVGASAGGLEALNGFFDTVVENSDYSYVIIQHLLPDHKSFMAELLSKKAKVPILAVTDNSEIKRNHIYVIPPAMNFIIEDNHLKLIDKPNRQKLNLPIDIFMESLATQYKKNAVGIILSGTGSDGSRGVQAIRKAGGVVLVQQPEQSSFDGMPQSAINTGAVDFIIPVEEMIDEIVRCYKEDETQSNIIDLTAEDEESLKSILQLLLEHTDINFSYYKRPTIVRRTARRFHFMKMESFKEYLAYLKINPEEINILYQEFLISVTQFFRDSKVWEVLESETIPGLVRSKDDGGTLKIWDVACSTGEEPYSLAMLFVKEIAKQDKNITLKIFATDLSQERVRYASGGVFSEDHVAHVPAALLKDFFNLKEDSYVIKEALRKKIIFSNHNILKDPPFKNMDMVVCRNMLIYLKSDIQAAVLSTLHYALKLDGILLLGASESITSVRQHFETLDSKWKIYSNIRVSERLQNNLKGSSSINKGDFSLARKQVDYEGPKKDHYLESIQRDISKTIVQMFDAASVYVDSDLKVVDAMGSFSKYASLPVTGFSLDLLKMLPESLGSGVSTAIRKAKRAQSEFILKDVITTKENESTLIDILVRPILSQDKEAYNYIITFIEKDLNPDAKLLMESSRASGSPDERITDLLEEIEEIRIDLKRALEGVENSNVELQTLNQELLASNEELQSTNGELQSVNEELHTVNVKHIQKMDDLALLNADMDNLLNSTEIATIFLDKDLTIRKFTPSIQEHFQLMKQDLGRPIDHFISQLSSSKKSTLKEKILKVIDSGKSSETRVVSKSGKSFIRRISPFQSNYSEKEGVVITFLNISKVVESQHKLRKSEKKFKEFYEEDPVMHVSTNPLSGIIIECNQTFVTALKYNHKEDVIGKRIMQFYNKKSKIRAVELLENIQRDKIVRSEEMMLIASDDTHIPVILSSELVENDVEESYTRSTLVDVSELKESQNIVIEKNHELERINVDLEQFVSICSHDLQEPLGTIRFSSDVILKKFGEGLDPKAEEYLGYIYGAAGRMADQIKGLLEHSRIGQKVERTTVDIQELLEIVKYDLGKRLKECRGEVYVGKMPLLNVYKTEFRLLLQNLIGNSLKYSREGVDPIVRVSAYQDGEFWTFALNDNGIGIAEDDLQSIFKIFGRAATQHKYEGTGVGLAHCEKIVKIHEGTIWVDSQVGVGSTFYFKIKA